MFICPDCHLPTCDRSTLIRVDGRAYRLVETFEGVEKVQGGTQEILFIHLEEKGAALKSKPTKESLTERPS